jgi:hypothetical protein
MVSGSPDYNLAGLVEEYTGIDKLLVTIDGALVRDHDWTEQGAEMLLHLAREYGSFVLINAAALAMALGIEDGAAGL